MQLPPRAADRGLHDRGRGHATSGQPQRVAHLSPRPQWHKSPNAGQTESVCAGALHVQLGGDASYFGKTVKKAAFGDPDRAINRGDILRSIDLMTTASVLALVLCAVIRLTLDWPLFG